LFSLSEECGNIEVCLATIKISAKNLGRFFANKKGWKLRPHSVLLVLVKRKEHLLYNKESRHCNSHPVKRN
jgi:hypothetical protein